MNRNVLIIGLVFSCLLLFIFVQSNIVKDSKSIESTLPSKSDSVTVEQVKKISSEEALPLLEGFWIAGNISNENESRRMVQLHLSKVHNRALKDGRWVEGILFSNDEKNPTNQSISSLEMQSFEDNKLIFKVENKDPRAFYDGLNLPPERSIKELIITLGTQPNFIVVLNDGNKLELKLNRLDFKTNAKLILSKWMLINQKGVDVKLNLDNINDPILGSGLIKFSSGRYCNGVASIKIRPIGDNLYLLTPAPKLSCLGIYSLKVTLDQANLLQAIGYADYGNADPKEYTFKN